MKRTNILILLWILWIVAIVATIAGVCKYIDQKKVTLRCELRDNIKKLFEGQEGGGMFVSNNDGYFFTEYSNSQVRHYKKVSNPSRPSDATASIDKKLGISIDKKFRI